ncbi:MAG: hypothetical protein LH614_22235 [Pyrinomonadaceae bacterium]|nr:hypothetical protein [Pyrinomonadaceae bacterium]
MIQRGFTLLKIDDKNFDAKFFWNELTNILLLMTKNVARNSKLATLNEKEENFIISKQRSMQSLETAIENAFSETAAEKSLIVTNFLYLHLSNKS